MNRRTAAVASTPESRAHRAHPTITDLQARCISVFSRHPFLSIFMASTLTTAFFPIIAITLTVTVLLLASLVFILVIEGGTIAMAIGPFVGCALVGVLITCSALTALYSTYYCTVITITTAVTLFRQTAMRVELTLLTIYAVLYKTIYTIFFPIVVCYCIFRYAIRLYMQSVTTISSLVVRVKNRVLEIPRKYIYKVRGLVVNVLSGRRGGVSEQVEDDRPEGWWSEECEDESEAEEDATSGAETQHASDMTGVPGLLLAALDWLLPVEEPHDHVDALSRDSEIDDVSIPDIPPDYRTWDMRYYDMVVEEDCGKNH